MPDGRPADGPQQSLLHPSRECEPADNTVGAGSIPGPARRAMARAHGMTISRNQGIHAAPPLTRPTPSQATSSAVLTAAHAAQVVTPRELITPWPR